VGAGLTNPPPAGESPAGGAEAAGGTRLADILSARRREGGRTRFTVTDDWLQGRAAYGGLVAALATQAIHDSIGRDRPLLALQISFIGAVGAGPADVDVTVLRRGKSVTQARAAVESGGSLACVALAVLGDARETALARRTPSRPPTAHPDGLREMPFLPGRMPEFMRHLAVRWAEGVPPFKGGDSDSSRLWLRLRGDRVAPELAAIMFADAMPSPAMAWAPRGTFGASLAWSIELLPAASREPGEGWWRADTVLTHCAGGYANQVSTIWTPHGDPAAFSQQVVAIYG
jgi:acyl-CoA thioesterase